MARLPQPLEYTLPGWYRPPQFHGQEPSSWGYHDNGQRYAKQSEKYGEKWAVGDTVGCGVDILGGRIWFVKNGKFQGEFLKLS